MKIADKDPWQFLRKKQSFTAITHLVHSAIYVPLLFLHVQYMYLNKSFVSKKGRNRRGNWKIEDYGVSSSQTTSSPTIPQKQEKKTKKVQKKFCENQSTLASDADDQRANHAGIRLRHKYLSHTYNLIKFPCAAIRTKD